MKTVQMVQMLRKPLKFIKQFSRFNLSNYVPSSASTIFALCSGQGKCGVAVIRVSGPSSKGALTAVAGLSALPKPRMALLRSLRHPISSELLDKGLILWFPGPHSFTGEDCFELHVHGGRAVINGILDALASFSHLRLAEPGEFTRRAFYNGKLDLTEVEGLADLLHAETETQRKQALYQMQGALRTLYNNWREKLTHLTAHIEAFIDFEETETLDDDMMRNIIRDVRNVHREIKNHLDNGRKGEILRNGVKTVIIGEPNVGKSSLLNMMCERPAAIVTPFEGTTRDLLEVTLNIGGYPLVLVDTAGLRSITMDMVEQEGINRALKSYQMADLIILVVDSSKYVQWLHLNPNKSFIDYIRYYVEKLKLIDFINYEQSCISKMFQKHCIVVMNKIDLTPNLNRLEDIVLISCKSEMGINELLKEINEKLKILCGDPSEAHPSMNQARHREHIFKCLMYLELFLNNSHNNDVVLLAEYLRQALKQLGKLVGAITTEQLLDVIFKDFCIGK